jgi:hypothetical protein
MELPALDHIPIERPVRTFVRFDGIPCLIADKNDLEYKLVTIDKSQPCYFYVNKQSLQELSGEEIDKPTPYRVNRMLDPSDIVYVLWDEYRGDKKHEVITFAYYISVNHAGTHAFLLNDNKQGFVRNSKERSIKQVFYFK